MFDMSKVKHYGYKVSFDGTKFVADESASELFRVPEDAPVAWFIDKVSAEETAAKYNAEKLKDVKQCKQCSAFFWQNDATRKWFADRGMKAPCRCGACRDKNKNR